MTMLTDENMDVVTGESGEPGHTPPATARHVSSAEIDASGRLIITYINGDVDNLGVVVGKAAAKGEKGETGASGRSIVAAEVDTAGQLVLTFSDGSQVYAGQVRPADGKKGDDGRGIEAMTIDEAGRLLVTYTDGLTEDAGLTMGVAGRSVTSVAINTANRIIVTFSDGATQDAGELPGLAAFVDLQRRVAALESGGGSTIPIRALTDASGNYLTDASGNYLTGAAA